MGDGGVLGRMSMSDFFFLREMPMKRVRLPALGGPDPDEFLDCFGFFVNLKLGIVRGVVLGWARDRPPGYTNPGFERIDAAELLPEEVFVVPVVAVDILRARVKGCSSCDMLLPVPGPSLEDPEDDWPEFCDRDKEVRDLG